MTRRGIPTEHVDNDEVTNRTLLFVNREVEDANTLLFGGLLLESPAAFDDVAEKVYVVPATSPVSRTEIWTQEARDALVAVETGFARRIWVESFEQYVPSPLYPFVLENCASGRRERSFISELIESRTAPLVH